MDNKKNFVISFSALISFLIILASNVLAADYNYFDMGKPADAERAKAYDVNNSLQVVGHCITSKNDYAFIWEESSGFTKLLPDGWISSYAYSINDSGQVVGYGYTGSATKGFLWEEGKGFTEIFPTGSRYSYAHDINNYAKVVGQAHYGTTPASQAAFIWDKDNGFEFLEVPSGWSYLTPTDINNNGQVAGNCEVEGEMRAFLWEGSDNFTDIGVPSGWTYTIAGDINDFAQITGTGHTGSAKQAFLWDKDVGFIEMLFPGWTSSGAYGINNSGQVVGRGYGAGGGPNYRAFIWDSDNGVTEISPPGWTNSEAYGINDNGYVVGYGYTGSEYHAFLAIPGTSLDESETVSAKATLQAGHTLGIQPKNVSDNSDAPGVSFGNVPGDTTYLAPLQYAAISYTNNEAIWKMEAYTDNSDHRVTRSDWHSGMLGANKIDLVPLVWRIYDDVQAGGVPCNDMDNWWYVSDKNDKGWVHGTTILAYGDVTTTHLGAYPSGGRTGSSPIHLYLGAEFTDRLAQTYSTTITIDLYHE